MSQVTYNKKSEKTAKKRVEFYNGTGSEVTLHTGYALCYNQDYGTASDADIGRAWQVEQPATANLRHFAGVLCEDYDGIKVANGKTKVVDIYVPTARGQYVLAWTEENCTINATGLAPEDGKFALGASNPPYDSAQAAQTVNRSSTNGTCLVRLLTQYPWDTDITATESELDLVSEALVAVDSQLLLIESEAAGNDSEILLLESEVAAAESELDLVSEAVVAVDSQLLLIESEVASNDSAILLLESQMSQAESRILLVESETAEVVNSDAITSGIVTTSSVTVHKAQISIRGVTYTFVTDIVAKA